MAEQYAKSIWDIVNVQLTQSRCLFGESQWAVAALIFFCHTSWQPAQSHHEKTQVWQMHVLHAQASKGLIYFRYFVASLHSLSNCVLRLPAAAEGCDG